MVPGGYSIKMTLGRPLNWEGLILTKPTGGSLKFDTVKRDMYERERQRGGTDKVEV